MQAMQNRIYETVTGGGLEVFSLEVRKPSLEDVYRIAVGGER